MNTTITIDDLLALKCEAGIVGDTAAHDLCLLALYALDTAEREAAWTECAKMVAAARAMEGT